MFYCLGQLNLDTKTAQKYVGLLETLFLVHQLRPWHGNTLSRIVKTPKIHFIDSGLLACLNRVTIESVEKDKSSFGALLETWVYSELLKMCTLANEPWNIYHYRDKDQVEGFFWSRSNHIYKDTLQNPRFSEIELF